MHPVPYTSFPLCITIVSVSAVCHKVSKLGASHERVCTLCELVLHLVRLQLLQGEQRQTQLVLLKHA